jgi:hypothetical protein
MYRSLPAIFSEVINGMHDRMHPKYEFATVLLARTDQPCDHLASNQALPPPRAIIKCEKNEGGGERERFWSRTGPEHGFN